MNREAITSIGETIITIHVSGGTLVQFFNINTSFSTLSTFQYFMQHTITNAFNIEQET